MSKHTLPTDGEAYKFALLITCTLPILFGILLPVIFGHSYPTWPWLAGVSFGLIGLIFPQAMKHIHVYWHIFGEKIGKVNTKIILSVFYVLVIVPIGLIMSMFKDPMRMKEKNTDSYRVLPDKQEGSMKFPF
jgi:heme/copper-type cytochrome/quinol oxidase subunit 4